MKSRALFISFTLFAFFFLLPSSVLLLYGAEPELRVLVTAGSVEIQRGATGRWTALNVTARPLAGDRIRTGEKSFADFAFDRGFDGMARLGEKSSAEISASSPARWELERGKFWVLWEYDADARGPFTLRAADAVDARIEGGAFVEARPPRVEIRSFGNVFVSGDGRAQGALKEGFRGVVEGAEAEPAGRLGYADYQDWREWMVEAYDHKDKALRPR